MLNLNERYLDVKRLGFGKTQNIEVKLGRRFYYVDVNKNQDSAVIDFYPKTTKSRNDQSKYSGGVLGVSVKPEAALGREFFEDIKQIKAAQEVMFKWRQTVK